jgi:hypothetical protein
MALMLLMMAGDRQEGGMTKGERRFLSRRVCGWCEMPLHRDSCQALYDPCSSETIALRRRRCLETYRPRSRFTEPKTKAPENAETLVQYGGRGTD